MLSVRIDRKTYPDRGGDGRRHLALRDLALHVAGGEFVCLVGPSGCGKSTLLNLIGGLDGDYAGTVQIGGAASGTTPAIGPGAAFSSTLGFMFQSPRLMPWLSVLDNVRLVLPGGAKDDARARQLLRAMDLGEVLDAYPGRLSGGMQRRVALARAFAGEPRLLLMDEPFVSLDAPTAERLRAMLLDLHARSGSSVLFVTHDLREALTLADRICFLSAAPGRIVHQEVLAAPRPRPAADVAALYDDLLQRHPDLLRGLAGPHHPVTELAA